MHYDSIVVGGGIAGLTAAAYLTKAGYSTLICEKENKVGGLVNTFERDGFVYDGGIRALENSGILFPMLKQLGLEIEFIKNHVSLGVEDQVIHLDSEESIHEYHALLNDLYPESVDEIDAIISEFQKIIHYMEVQYGIDNPAFLDVKEDSDYFIKTIFPWMFRYAFTVRKINAYNVPVIEFLKRFTQNQSLLDIIAQHFFQDTPAFFALSYLKLYLDYYYPRGGTGVLVDKIAAFIREHGGMITTDTRVVAVDPDEHQISDENGNRYQYKGLIWAADLNSLYRFIDVEKLSDHRVRTTILNRRESLKDKLGNDSIFTIYLGLDLDKSYFASKASEHFFYTPKRDGQSNAGPLPVGEDRETIEKWLEDYFNLTTYEIACPVMRDSSLAPEGKTGLIVSVLFDYQLTKYIHEMGWYEEFKALCEELILRNLNRTIYPGVRESILHQFSSTPLTMERYTHNTHGAITGWSFTNNPMPAESRLPKIFSSTQTPIPGIAQAGQWTYSPSGLPISILTGKLAADRVIKEIK